MDALHIMTNVLPIIQMFFFIGIDYALTPNNILYGVTTEFTDIFNRPISDEPTNWNWAHTKSCCPIGLSTHQ